MFNLSLGALRRFACEECLMFTSISFCVIAHSIFIKMYVRVCV